MDWKHAFDGERGYGGGHFGKGGKRRRLSDPNKPVPYVDRIVQRILNSYMTEDQRFAAMRPDVLVFQTEPLDHDVSVFGPIQVDLKVSTSGTDSDFDVKVIDVFPHDYPDYNNAAPGAVRRGGWGDPADFGSERGADGRIPGIDPGRAIPR